MKISKLEPNIRKLIGSAQLDTLNGLALQLIFLLKLMETDVFFTLHKMAGQSKLDFWLKKMIVVSQVIKH
jgi:hypothetical protein